MWLTESSFPTGIEPGPLAVKMQSPNHSGSAVKKSTCNIGDAGSIPGLGRSPGRGNGNQLQYSCLKNPMNRGVGWATVYGATESDMTDQLRTSRRKFNTQNFQEYN